MLHNPTTPPTLETTHVLDHSLRFHHRINNKRTVEKTIKTGETNSSPARRPGWETPTSTFPSSAFAPCEGPFRFLLLSGNTSGPGAESGPVSATPKCDDCATMSARVDPSSDLHFAQKTCMRWFSRSQTTMLPLGMTAMPSSPLNSPSPEPHWPKARRKEPSGWKICMRLLPESPTMM